VSLYSFSWLAVAVAMLELTFRNQCVVLQTPLVDGSPCGYGGHCYNSSCQAGPWQDRFEEMYTQNLQISIPVTIVVGIIVSHIYAGQARENRS